MRLNERLDPKLELILTVNIEACVELVSRDLGLIGGVHIPFHSNEVLLGAFQLINI